MKKIYKIPVGDMSEKEAKIFLHTMKKKYQQSVAWSEETKPLTMRTYYIKLDELKPKQTSFYKLGKYSIGNDIYILEVNIKLFDRIKKISKITKTDNKEVEYINELMKHQIDIMEYLRDAMLKATKTPKKYVYPASHTIIDYTTQLKETKYTDDKISDKLHKFIKKLKENMI